MRPMRACRSGHRRSAIAAAAIAVLACGATAQEPALPDSIGSPGGPTGTAALEAEASDLDDVSALRAWLDGFMTSHIDELPSAGATVAVVKDGRLLLARGYGLADVENDIPVADSTLFRIGSVSKLFTWTAVMQLVERGLIDLDADINDYMPDVRIPATFDEPITMKHLMTHTPGFEDHVVALFGQGPESLRPFADILNDEMPRRVRPPGEVAAYSNHGTGMAAYIVEQVSGMPFADYVQANILDPLGMDETTIAQPIPEALAERASRGYSNAGDEFDEEPFEYVPLAPVGGVSSSARDMAKLMIAFLHDGRLGDARIISEATAREMREPLFRHADGVNPALHGFMDMSQGGQRVIGHGGDTFWFHTLFALLPEHDVGVFVSYNTENGSAGRAKFIEAFLDRFFPVPDPEPIAPDPAAAGRLKKFAGAYRVDRYSHSDFTKVAVAVNPLTVSVTEDGTLKTSATGSTEFAETGDDAFRAVDGREPLAFREDADGRVEYAFFGPFQVVAFERASGLGNPGLQALVLGVCGGIFALAALFWPVTAIVRWRYGATPPPARRLPRWGRAVGWSAAVAFPLFLLLVLRATADPTRIALGDISGIRVALWIGVIAAALGIATAGLAAWFWVKRTGALIPRILYSAVGLASVVSIWQMSFWNLLGPRL